MKHVYAGDTCCKIYTDFCIKIKILALWIDTIVKASGLLQEVMFIYLFLPFISLVFARLAHTYSCTHEYTYACLHTRTRY